MLVFTGINHTQCRIAMINSSSQYSSDTADAIKYSKYRSWVKLDMMLRYHILKLSNYTCYSIMIIAYYFSYWELGALFH